MFSGRIWQWPYVLRVSTASPNVRVCEEGSRRTRDRQKGYIKPRRSIRSIFNSNPTVVSASTVLQQQQQRQTIAKPEKHIVMKVFIVLSALVAVGLSKPSGLVTPLVYARLVPGAPIGLDGRVVDTPEVHQAKNEHAAAHLNEKLNLANEALRSADYIAYASAPIASAPIVAASYAAPAIALTKYTAGGAPIGIDGRTVDTPEVAYAKAQHAAAVLNEKLEHSNAGLKSGGYLAYASAPISAVSPIIATSYAAGPALALTKYTAGGAPIGLDGRTVDTPEVAYAKAEHEAAKFNANIEHGQEILKNSIHGSPLLVSAYAAPAYAAGYIQHYY